MIANADIQPNTVEQLCGGLKDTTDPASDCRQLAQENSCLRVIIAELLLKNQHLRWALLGQGSGPLPSCGARNTTTDQLRSRSQAVDSLRGDTVM
jgi:hypothetical protein